MTHRMLIKLSLFLIGVVAYANPNGQSFIHPPTTGLLFNVIINSNTLNINTAIQNNTYPTAGIRINTPGYSVATGCTSIANGYCVFSVSDTSPAHIIIHGPTAGSGTVDFTLCLNGQGPLSCQDYMRSGQFSPPSSPIITSVTGYNNPLIFTGENFIPALGDLGESPRIFLSHNDPTCNPSNMVTNFISAGDLTSSTQFNATADGAPLSPICLALCKASVSTYTGPTTECTNAFYDNTP